MQYQYDPDHRRTITWPVDRAQHVKVAADYLGVSSEQFIWQAVTAYLRLAYGTMVLDR